MALQEQIRKLHDEKFELNACLMVNKMEAAQEASKEIRSLQSQLRFKVIFLRDFLHFFNLNVY